MRKVIFLLFMFSLTLTIIGCGGGGGGNPDLTRANITGTVTEEGTNNALSGAKVELGDKTTTTDANGNYRFTNIPVGDYALKASLEGYYPYYRSVTISSNETLNIQMNTNGPIVNNQQLVLTGPNGISIHDQMELEENVSFLIISGNVNNLISERTQSGVSIRSNGLTIDKLQALVNSVVYEIPIEQDGSFSQNVPLNTGNNTIQLRVYDSNGNAGSGPVIRVKVTIQQMDIRVVLEWDTNESDVDLHMYKRTKDEPSPSPQSESEWDSEDRHIYWGNPLPDDFGDGNKQNPLMDIDDTDGYGPETLVLQEATEGHYHIWAYYYDAPQDSNHDAIPSNITLTVILKSGTNEAVTHEIKRTLLNQEEALYLCTVIWPSGEIVDSTPVEHGKSIGKSIKRISLKKKKSQTHRKLIP
jgi:uncharacterized protein YfaP (DUF2135 family)